MLGGGGATNWLKKYNIDYFGYAVNLEFKFKALMSCISSFETYQIFIKVSGKKFKINRFLGREGLKNYLN